MQTESSAENSQRLTLYWHWLVTVHRKFTVARAEVEPSRGATVGARVSSILNPYLEVIAERGRGVTHDIYVTAQAHTPIEVAGQQGRRIVEADSFVEWNSSTLEQLRAQVSGTVVRRYGECMAWAARHETLTELMGSAATEAKVLAARRDAVDATERDVQLAEVERARIAMQLEEAQASLGAALNELARLTGRRFGPPDINHLFLMHAFHRCLPNRRFRRLQCSPHRRSHATSLASTSVSNANAFHR